MLFLYLNLKFKMKVIENWGKYSISKALDKIQSVILFFTLIICSLIVSEGFKK
jgi:hypothetical protein